VNKPSFSIAAAPERISSAGCPTSIKVPRQCWRFCAISSAVPTHADICRSCPQACITGMVSPTGFLVLTVLANGSPVPLLDRQSIQFSAQHRRRPRAVLEDCNDASAPNAGGHFISESSNALSEFGRRPLLVKPKLRIAMEVNIELFKG